MPDHAKALTDLLEEREAWKEQVRDVFYLARSASGMTQTDFAETVGISQPYLNQIEHGQRTPSSETLNKLRSFMEGDAYGNAVQDSRKAREE